MCFQAYGSLIMGVRAFCLPEGRFCRFIGIKTLLPNSIYILNGKKSICSSQSFGKHIFRPCGRVDLQTVFALCDTDDFVETADIITDAAIIVRKVKNRFKDISGMHGERSEKLTSCFCRRLLSLQALMNSLRIAFLQYALNSQRVCHTD